MKRRRCVRCPRVAVSARRLPNDKGGWGDAYEPVCAVCSAALDGLEQVGARGVCAVDRAVRLGQGVAAAEAVGHFLRAGRPGPSRFASLAPPSVRASLTSAALERALPDRLDMAA